MSVKKVLALVVGVPALCLMTSSTVLAGGSSARPPAEKVEVAEGRIIIKFKQKSRQPSIQSNGVNNNIGSYSKNSVAVMNGVNGLTQETVTQLNSMGVSVQKTFAHVGISKATTRGNVGKAIEALLRSGLVEYAEPAYKVKTSAWPQDPPNDPNYTALWGLNQGSDVDIDAPEAWKIKSIATTSIVGVVDTGVDYSHEDLRDNMWKNPYEIANNGIDDDGNGYVDDIYGIDTWNYDSDPMDDNAHGTHVAGTIGAKGNNAKGVIGVAPSVKIMALKFLNNSGSGYTDDAIELINYMIAIRMAHQGQANYKRLILNNSWGGGGYSIGLYDAINDAKDNNILFVAAAGNDGMNTDTNPMYPAAYDLPNIISVGSSDSNENLSYFSNYGCSSVDVIAPGSDILSTVPSNGYAYFSGTSMATPHVAGAAALLWAKAPNTSSWGNVKAAIMNSVEQTPSYANTAVTQGRINLLTALSSTGLTKPTVFEAMPSILSPGETVRISGINFGTSTGTITFNGIPLTVNSWSAKEIWVTIPAALSFGKGVLQVTNAAGVSSNVGACASVEPAQMSFVGRTLIPRGWATDVQIGNQVWIIGGWVPWGTATGLVERVTLGNKLRAEMNSDWIIPLPVTNAGSTALNGKIYVVGGYADIGNGYYEAIDTLQIFDTTTNTWTNGTPLPQPIMQANVVVLGGKVAVFGGQDVYGNILDTTYIYDTASNTWASKASMPTARAYAKAIRVGTPTSATKAQVIGGLSSEYLGSELSNLSSG